MSNQNTTGNPDIPPSSNGETIPPAFVTIPEAELEQIKREATEYKDKYLRSLADADNLQKRLQKERQDFIQYAVENAIIEVLNPIDHFENALKFAQQASDDVKHWAVGFQMILTQFRDALANVGVTAFKSEGMPFDPHCHEAIEMIATSEHPPGIVIIENMRGYKMGERVIRPARVKVSKTPATVSNKEEKNQ